MSASAIQTGTKITVNDNTLRERLRDRLDRMTALRCGQHDQSVVAVSIHVRENGWFDSTWTTCCESLEQQATAIVKSRC